MFGFPGLVQRREKIGLGIASLSEAESDSAAEMAHEEADPKEAAVDAAPEVDCKVDDPVFGGSKTANGRFLAAPMGSSAQKRTLRSSAERKMKSESAETPIECRVRPCREVEEEEAPGRKTSTGSRRRMSHRVISPPFVLSKKT